jgi:hypothetical protein
LSGAARFGRISDGVAQAFRARTAQGARMKLRALLPLAAAFAASVAPPFALAADAPKDALCPRAVPKLVAFTDAGASNDVAKIAAAAQAAADAYQACATDSSVSAPIEPAVNYDKVRRAQFLVVVGRADAAAGKTAEAMAALRDARSTADDVAQWQPSSMSYSTSNRTSGTSSDRNGDRNGSRYRESAVQIRAAADQALESLKAGPPAGSSPSPGPSPAAR